MIIRYTNRKYTWYIPVLCHKICIELRENKIDFVQRFFLQNNCFETNKAPLNYFALLFFLPFSTLGKYKIDKKYSFFYISSNVKMSTK